MVFWLSVSSRGLTIQLQSYKKKNSHFKLCLATMTHNFKRGKITHNLFNSDQKLISNSCHFYFSQLIKPLFLSTVTWHDNTKD